VDVPSSEAPSPPLFPEEVVPPLKKEPEAIELNVQSTYCSVEQLHRVMNDCNADNKAAVLRTLRCRVAGRVI